MFKFSHDQKIFDISGLRIGGQPGQLPTTMIGSIFYNKQNIFKDEKTGKFDKEKAEELLQREKVISEKTGNPRIVDVCCSWPQNFNKYIEFAAKTIEGPFTIDGTTADVRIAGARYTGEVGLSNRIVYNSITPHTSEQEIMAIKEAKIKTAILLTLNSKNPTIAGRLEVLDEVVSISRKAGIENILVDTAVFDVPDPGPVSKTIFLIKEKYGLPAGSGTHNSIARLTSIRKLDSIKNLLASCVANIFPIGLGADFMLYGPIENASNAYYSAALADAYVAYSARQEFGISPLNRNHPLFRIFRN
jgi:tetrahydromethanopterin S-methyltransferase subunit H